MKTINEKTAEEITEYRNIMQLAVQKTLTKAEMICKPLYKEIDQCNERLKLLAEEKRQNQAAAIAKLGERKLPPRSTHLSQSV